MSTITVRQHLRRRSGKTAKVAAVLGLDSNVSVAPYKRRRPSGQVWRHQDDKSFCSLERSTLIPRRQLCPHGKEVESA